MLKKFKKAMAVLLAAAAVFNCAVPAAADDSEITVINIKTNKDREKISRYIYGINDNISVSDVTVSSIKQTGAALSSYNWETNTSNAGAGGNYINGYDLVSAFSRNVLSTPALYTRNLIDKASLYEIPGRFVTLQMMGRVSNDSSGVVNKGEERRWADISFNKGEDLLIYPDVNDDMVYIDEYVSYLVNNYGFASDGEITGYFLDSEPENWINNYGVLGMEPVTAADLLAKSADLADTVKSVDPSAMVLGPSVSGIGSYVNLKNESDWEQYKEHYSWFIDYYLDNMRMASEKKGKRLLDVLDLHFFTEARTVLLEPVISTDTRLANEERMQAVRVLWDSDYTENSAAALRYKQHTPVIPTIQASIRMYYPGTKLSFSEYDFGGGSDISGGIAQADVLGLFGREGVYMACLKPSSDDIDYQKSAINLYTDYDGDGSSFGDVSVYADNGGDKLSSVYASVESEDDTMLRAVLMNKNMGSEKNIKVNIDSPAEYHSAKVYSFDYNSPEIVFNCVVDEIENNSFEFEMEPLTVYMFEFSCGEVMIEETVTEATETETETEATEISVEESDTVTENASEVTEDTGISETVKTEEAKETEVPASEIKTELQSEIQEESHVTDIVSSRATVTAVTEPEQVITETTAPTGEKDAVKVPMAVKVVVSLLVAAVVIAIIYIVVTDIILSHQKK